VGRRAGRFKINTDRENSKNQEEEDGDPGTPSGSFDDYAKRPQDQEYREKKNQSLRVKGEVEMA